MAAIGASAHILVADEELDCSRALCGLLEKDGYEVDLASDGEIARRTLESDRIDLLIADLVVPGVDGFELLQMARRTHPETPVILVSGYGTIETAVRALKLGAYHYFQKPLDLEAVRAVVTEALGGDGRSAPPTASSPARATSAAGDALDIVGRGSWFEDVMSILEKLAPTRATALLSGESGTGKELFARAIHNMSGRRGPFVAVSCSVLARELLESELFGHEKGAFTGADRQKIGRFELAHGGTLLLDEVGDIAPDLQVKLLRVLQERQFERVGGTQSIDVDVRIIAATNRDLTVAVREHAFREDLYYRLKVVEINLPPLRERRQDVEALAQRFVETYARANGKQVVRTGAEVLKLLERYPWPGNVRELENAVERAVVLSEPEATELDVQLLPDSVREGTPTLCPGLEWSSSRAGGDAPARGFPHSLTESGWIRSLSEALHKSGGSAAGAARLLDVSPATIRRAADEYGLPRTRSGSRGPR